MNLVDILRDRSTNTTIGITFVGAMGEEVFISYAELMEAASMALFSLQQKGIRPGSEVILQIDDNRQFLVAFWACLLGGIIPVPLSLGKTDDQKKKLFHVWSLLNNPYLVISQEDLGHLRSYAVDKGLEDQLVSVSGRIVTPEEAMASTEKGSVYAAAGNEVAFIQFSSGSTSDPKGVVLTHDNIISNIRAIANAAVYTSRDRLLSWMPLTHDMGMIGFHLSPLFSGLNQYLIPTKSFVRNPSLWLDKASDYKVTVTSSPNFGYRYLLRHLKGDKKNWDLSHLRIIYNGAEPISQDICREFTDTISQYGLQKTAMRPVYGLAEASVAVSMSDPGDIIRSVTVRRDQLNLNDLVVEVTASPNSTSFVNVGKAIDCCSLRIADKKNDDLGEGRVGYVMIKGSNVTTGYYNNPVASAATIDPAGWLNTGDLGFIKDGSLYITGRAKDVIFINGQNFFSHDVEKEAETIEGIELNEIVVASAFNPATQVEEPITFLLRRGKLDDLVPRARLLKAHTNQVFGFEFKKIIPVPQIPRTTSGKLQRFKLLEKYLNGEYQQSEAELATLLASSDTSSIVKPADETEARLLELWARNLEISDIGVETSFFSAGGDSLKAADLIIKILQEFNVDLGFEKLYELQTIRRVAAEIKKQDRKQVVRIPRTERDGLYPLTPSQRRLFFAWKVDPSSIAYNIPVAIKLSGSVNVEKLASCILKVVSRHDALRIVCLPTVAKFQVAKEIQTTLKCIDCPKAEWQENLKSLVTPFNLSEGPLYRFFLLIDRTLNESVLLLDFHHIVSDGLSAWRFVKEVTTEYNGRMVSPTDIGFVDWAVWIHNNEKVNKDAAEKYWLSRFSGDVPLLELPYDFPRPPVLSTRGSKKRFRLNESTTRKLKDVAIKYNVTNHAVFFALYYILLSKLSGAKDIVIGVPVHGRNHPDVQLLHGMFVNNAPIRNSTESNSSFIDVLKDCSRLISESIDHPVPFDELVEMVRPAYRQGRNPLFDTMFMYQTWNLAAMKTSDFELEVFPFDPGFSKFDISMEVVEDRSCTAFSFEYAAELFDEKTIDRFANSFETIANQVCTTPQVKISDILAIDQEEYHEFIWDYNNTTDPSKLSVSVPDLVSETIREKPNSVAIEFRGKEITYEAFNVEVGRIVNALRSKSVKEGDIVGICLSRTPGLVASIMAVLNCGAAYLPLEIGMPVERMKFILRDSGCKLLIGGSLHNDLNIDILDIEKIPVDSLQSFSHAKTLPSNLAYVIYTSGTTGVPKGVMVGHESLSNYIRWASERYVDGAATAFALYSSISFDLTITSIFTPLVTGNRIVIYEEDDSKLAIAEVVQHNRADVIKLTPSHLRTLKDMGLLTPALRARRLIVGGEGLDTNLALQVYELLDGKVEILNEYGPTEATVGCMIYRFNKNDSGKTVSIGRPISNTQIYLLDEDLKPVATNVPGYMYIGGAGLAKGYLSREELTKERFIENPYIPGARIYKTGDVARRLADETLEFIGRVDQQVKINGNRVELTEIESQLKQCHNVKDVIVLLDDKNRSNLLAFIVPGDLARPLSDEVLTLHLGERVPYFMIPAEFIMVDNIPLTPNGKVDTISLLNKRSSVVHRNKAIPTNEIESVLVKVWKEILDRDEVGTTDNFFALGGDSIKAVQLSAKLFEENISVTVKDILTHHTIRNISRFATRSFVNNHYEQGAVQGTFAPTPIQRWFFSQNFKDPNYYNQSVLFEVPTSLEFTTVERSIEILVEHHDILSVKYDSQYGTFSYSSPIASTTRRGERGEKERSMVQAFRVGTDSDVVSICNDVRASLDIRTGVLIRCAVIYKQDGAQLLFFTIHHLVMDGISWRIFLDDFINIYHSLAGGNDIVLPKKTASFKEWSLSLQKMKAGMEDEEFYWAKVLANGFTLPADFDDHDRFVKNAKTISVELDAEVSEFLLKDAHKSYNTDVPILLNAALVLALRRWTGLDEFIIDQESHGRHLDDIDTSRSIGWFACMYPVKFNYKEEIGELLTLVKESLRNVPAHGIGFSLNSKPGYERVSEVRLNYLGQFGREVNNDLLSLRREGTGNEAGPENHLSSKLDVNALVINGKLRVEITYSSTMFKESSVSAVSDYFIESIMEILDFLRNDGKLHFTPSDFSAVSLDQDELKALFG